ncbi:MAG: DUF2851 family protein [Bacteroidota bacterium]
MKEELLHYVWRTRGFDQSNLFSTEGDPIIILYQGKYNTNEGPDFLEAKVRIADKLWIGQIEIHIKSSDWLLHKHSYSNVILHVVLEEDVPIYNSLNSRIPCLELRSHLSKKMLAHYVKLMNTTCWVPCESLLLSVSDFTKNIWMESLAIERLQQRVDALKPILFKSKNDWETLFFQLLSKSLGMKVNAEAMWQLAETMPLSILLKHKNQLLQLEALLFGQAGMLSKAFIDDYPGQLKKEYAFLRHKYDLHPMTGNEWRFLRLRPSNFPTIRIAQLAQLIHQTDRLFSKAMAACDKEEVRNMFEVTLSNYWYDHYVFDKLSKASFKRMGKLTIQNILLNTVIPLLFLYADQKQDEALKKKALFWLQDMKPEHNSIIRNWENIGFQATSALQTQALIQLKSQYCDQQRCMNCRIGHEILSSK